MKVGIDSMSFSIPKIHLPIKTLAENRNIEPEKLIKGLGLTKMSFLDVHQDVVTLAANAVLRLINQEEIKPDEIARIYVGTESGVDSSKPIASYIISLLETQFGDGSFRNCDVTDITFACIGAVDALQTTLDFVRLNPTKKAIVVATDNAKYDLKSTGEYTQGAGAIAILITANPRILSFNQEFGVSTQGVFDFFKPRRRFTKQQVTLQKNNPEFLGVLENEFLFYKEQPVFDGQYSNDCYIERITDAYFHFKKETNQTNAIFQNWENVLMHLPYSYQGRRTFVEIYAQENPEILLDKKHDDYKEKLKTIAKSTDYLTFVNQKIAPSEIASGQIGNIYSGSIFLGLLSTLSYHFENDSNITNKKFGFIAYGSGSKAKVFEGEVQESWKEVLEKINLFETINQSQAIDFNTYLKLHKKEQKNSILEPENEFVLDYIENDNPVLTGARYYKFK
ncbi:MAG: hydroxymethylglutaryl-CoA synthase [Flavobacterium sp.]|nr:hydroxymethylglutaryl-CoA synthase [Flavobacterium sp.]